MKAQIKEVWYNAIAGAFEGRVDIARDAGTFRYPCVVEGPANMPRQMVRRQMVAQARQMSDSRGARF
ncbi:hypothetical protein [Yoonia litorea]|uniref:Uncharacterized protein n=1 Tax=Yoonia litorea TaxID=1123755 RepID=A0A1I6N0A5_9RHOB|nr:hypothetical protein [Yoonia litorea]SFS21218.1 hypothetical protein SAMN05444714_2770 [Yoonia litorea]